MDGLDRSFPVVPSPDSKARLAELVRAAVAKAFPDTEAPEVELERPKNADHGDFATNVALQLARRVGRKPREAAEAIVAALGASDGDRALRDRGAGLHQLHPGFRLALRGRAPHPSRGRRVRPGQTSGRAAR